MDESSKFVADESLIAQALMKGTGAVIHRLKGVIGSYRSCEHLIECCPPERKAHWQERAKKLETDLRKFIYTGELEK